MWIILDLKRSGAGEGIRTLDSLLGRQGTIVGHKTNEVRLCYVVTVTTSAVGSRTSTF